MKQIIKLIRACYGKQDTLSHLREYHMEGSTQVGTLDEWYEKFPNAEFIIEDHTQKVTKEVIRVGLKKTKNYQSYECSIEKEIEYISNDMRDTLVSQIYAQCRKDISKQMEVDGQ